MVSYTSQYQTHIEEFSNLCQLKLDPTNRWIQLGAILPWDEMVKIYLKNFDHSVGAPSIDPRHVLGAIIIKHKLGLSDEATIEIIRENPFMQVFLGLRNFCPKPLFSPTLFVEIRKRLIHDEFRLLNQMLHQLCQDSDAQTPSKTSIQADLDSSTPPKGHLKIDATVADQCISYPTDLSLINQAREKTDELVDQLFDLSRDAYKVKPRTYRQQAHKRYLEIAKQKKPQAAKLNMAKRYLLNCVQRNLGYINKMLDELGSSFPLSASTQRTLWVVTHLYQQQRHMYEEKTNTHPDRIVSISQPHVRPIVRGKVGRSVEFGAKLGLSLYDNILFEDKLSWDNYNECNDLQGQAETYRLLKGYYPELIQCDRIYHTNENRNWCKERNIRMTAAPKGAPKPISKAEKRKRRQEVNERNHIEGKIGNAKQALSLNEIKAKLKRTSESWIGATIFVLNLATVAKVFNFTF